MRIKNKLTSLALKKITQPGRYSDGNNLYLKVEETGSRRWILRLSINGKRRDIGLDWWNNGAYDTGPTFASVFTKIENGMEHDEAILATHKQFDGTQQVVDQPPSISTCWV